MIFLLPCWDVFCQHCLGASMLDLETQKVFWTASEELLSEHTSQEIVSKHLEEKEHYQKHIKEHNVNKKKTCNNT